MITIGNENCKVYIGNVEIKVYVGDVQIYPDVEPIDYSTKYLTFDIISGGTIGWVTRGSNVGSKTIEYSINNGAWNSISGSTEITGLTAGDNVRVRGTNSAYAVDRNNYCGFGGGSAIYDVYGNIMSLTDGDNFEIADTLSTDFTFYQLFKDSNVHSAENLILPVKTLTPSCYRSLFNNCRYLTKAPKKIYALSLADNCYQFMFGGCTSLTTAPELPATTLATNCYYYMFTGCTSLTTAPELPATTLANGCYQGMFYGCTSLTTGPSSIGNSATTVANSACTSMFQGCTSLTTAPELPATTLATRCYGNMFQGCSSLTTVPSSLPATTLANNCYQSMFNGCTGLTSAPELPATTLANGCYNQMFRNCSSLNYIKCLATDISASNCTYDWVYNVAASGTFVKAQSMTEWTSGTSGIPSNWTVQDTQ